MRLEEALDSALSGVNEKVVKLPHRWLNVFAQNVYGHPAITVALQTKPGYFIDSGKGFDVTLHASAPAKTPYLRITSTEAAIQPAFVALCTYMLDQSDLASSLEESTSAYLSALERFRDFLSKPRGRLSTEAIRGLAAELTLIEVLLDGGTTIEGALQAWQGPFFNSKDFVFPSGHCVEVKSAHRPTTDVMISSVEQLEPSNGSLQLAVVPIEKTIAKTPESRSIREMYLAVKETADLTPVSRKLWEVAADAIGFDENDPFYDDFNFVLGDLLFFDVIDDFPRISSDLVPTGVSAVSYKLSVSALANYSAVLRVQ